MNRPPVVENLQQLPPDPQTVIGVLEFDTTPAKTLDIPGDKSSDAAYSLFEEYIDQFTVSSSDSVNKKLVKFDPLCVNGVNPNNVNTALSMPIWNLLTRSSDYIDCLPSITFQAVKCVTTPCKIMIVQEPPTDPGWENWCPHTVDASDNSLATTQDSRLRMIKWEWDLASSDTFTISPYGWMTGCMRPTRFPIGSQMDQLKYGDNVHPTYMPYENYSMGTFHVYIAQPYQPGGIFPSVFDVNIWKSFKYLQNAVYTHFSGSYSPDYATLPVNTYVL